MTATRDAFDLVATFTLDRVMPAPMAVTCVVATVTSDAWWATAAVSVGLVAGHVTLNQIIARRHAAGRELGPLFATWRLAISLLACPLLALSSGPAGLGWLPGVIAILVLPFFFSGRRLAGAQISLGLGILGAMALAGADGRTLLTVATTFVACALLTGPLIRSLREHHAETQAARAAAEIAANARAQFLASMSHELRTSRCPS